MKYRIYTAAIVLIIILSGCLSSNDKFFLQKLDETDKAAILTKKGIELYELQLETDDDFSLIPEIRKCYEVALKYDPAISLAIKYNEILDNFISETYTAYIAKINSNREKSENRSIDDNYRLCLYIIKAYELDPENPEINDIRKETRPVLDTLIAEYVVEANSLTNNAMLETDSVKREELLVQALSIYDKIEGIDPGNKQIGKESRAAKEMLLVIMDEKIHYLYSRIADQYYTVSVPGVNNLSDYNKKVGNERQDEVDELQYYLYFEWAKYMYNKGDLDVAYSKVNAAIYFIEKDEAVELRDEIGGKLAEYREERNAAALAESFNEFIEKIDTLIADEELAIAYNRIREIESTLDSSQKRQVNERKTEILDKLAPIYEAGVEAYIQENFADAINKFSLIVDIDRGYEDAAAYLEKAKAKQALLESY
jgi:hypothetical protein